MDLDHRSTQFCRRLELSGFSRNEQRNAHASIVEPGDEGRQMIVLAGGVEPALSGALRALLRYQADRVRHGLERDGEHLVGRRHLEIERLVDFGFQARDIVIADVATILAQVRGDAVGAGNNRELGGTHRIGMATAAGVADGGDVIDIDSEA